MQGESRAKKIRRLFIEKGRDVRMLADQFDLTPDAIRKIVRGESYPDESYCVPPKPRLSEIVQEIIELKGHDLTNAKIGKLLGKLYRRKRPYAESTIRAALRGFQEQDNETES
jgi:hypothetical protein